MRVSREKNVELMKLNLLLISTKCRVENEEKTDFILPPARLSVKKPERL